jgi:uncharacterized phage protein (TIGR02218 family)
MRPVPAALQARLDSGVTTLAQAWTLTRRDGLVMGFTDHDRDLVIDGVVHRAGTGLAASEASSRFDLSVDGGEIAGAFDDAVLTDADLAAGRYDAAAVETWLVDWSEPSLRLLTARGTLGEVRRQGAAFVAELRGPADALAQDSGRLYTARCNADLGDARCRADLGNPAWHSSGSVAALRGVSQFEADGLGGFADGWFGAGRLLWTSGANVGLAMEIKQHRLAAGHVVLSLWQAMPEPLASGDAFTVTAGCDKTLATCRDSFANVDNFRGFPHVPGNDFVMSYPMPGTVMDDGGGGSLFDGWNDV